MAKLFEAQEAVPEGSGTSSAKSAKLLTTWFLEEDTLQLEVTAAVSKFELRVRDFSSFR